MGPSVEYKDVRQAALRQFSIYPIWAGALCATGKYSKLSCLCTQQVGLSFGISGISQSRVGVPIVFRFVIIPGVYLRAMC